MLLIKYRTKSDVLKDYHGFKVTVQWEDGYIQGVLKSYPYGYYSHDYMIEFSGGHKCFEEDEVAKIEKDVGLIITLGNGYNEYWTSRQHISVSEFGRVYAGEHIVIESPDTPEIMKGRICPGGDALHIVPAVLNYIPYPGPAVRIQEENIKYIKEEESELYCIVEGI